MAKRKQPKTITEWVNSLTPKQACRLIEFVSPLTDEERAEFDAMSNDDLVNALRDEA